jgi:hypothetical protein
MDGASAHATLLAALLRERNWDRYGVFRVEYEKAAKRIDPNLVVSTPSRAQWHRWMTGEVKRQPYVDHCRVLEAMLPGWTARQLFSQPCSGRTEAGGRFDDGLGQPPSEPAAARNVGTSAGSHADVTAIFTSRTDFADNVSAMDLFEGATKIRAAGLSLNLLCQQFADQRLRRLVESGTTLHALFLKPDGDAIRARETEEGIGSGHLSTLTNLNIDMLRRLRSGIAEGLRDNIWIGLYDETIRLNITLVDDNVCVAQPYLPGMRGVDSPTLLIRRDMHQPGLFDTFERVFGWLLERSTPL